MTYRIKMLRFFSVIILALFCLQGCGWTVRRFFPYLIEHQRLELEGEDAVAEIVSVAQTGVYLNKQPELELELLVMRKNGERVVSRTNLICPLIAIPRYQPGNLVPVKIDQASNSVTVTGSYSQTPWM